MGVKGQRMVTEETFASWHYLWPPRPELAVPPAMLSFYRNHGYVAQLKKNGTCTVLGRCDDKEVKAYTRHNEKHKLWKPNYESPSLRAFKRLGSKWFVFACELLHSKTAIKDTLCIWDILVADNQELTNLTFIQRMDLLYRLFPEAHESREYRGLDMIDERLAIIRPIVCEDFTKIFNSLILPEDEGLVLKDPNAPLLPCYTPSANASWQVKCRRPTKNYSN
jgi:uncharacterized C2H2 Zn-finger protein